MKKLVFQPLLLAVTVMVICLTVTIVMQHKYQRITEEQKQQTEYTRAKRVIELSRQTLEKGGEVIIGTFGLGKNNIFDLTPTADKVNWSLLLEKGTIIMIGEKEYRVISSSFQSTLGMLTIIVHKKLSPMPAITTPVKVVRLSRK